MNLLTASEGLVRRSRPLVITAGNLQSGSRIGGLPPAGVRPRAVGAWTQYFATLAVDDDADPGTELSIFLSAESPAHLWDRRYRLIDETDPMVQTIAHVPAARAKSSRFRSDLSGHGLRLGAARADDAGNPEGDGKIGGPAYYHHDYVPSIREDTARALSDGYFHFLQFNFPGATDAAVSGPWPFGEWVFHLFVKRSGEGYRFRYGWA
jgi:hypothetical protein